MTRSTIPGRGISIWAREGQKRNENRFRYCVDRVIFARVMFIMRQRTEWEFDGKQQWSRDIECKSGPAGVCNPATGTSPIVHPGSQFQAVQSVLPPGPGFTGQILSIILNRVAGISRGSCG